MALFSHVVVLMFILMFVKVVGSTKKRRTGCGHYFKRNLKK
jgi:hypothetical protein